jgi:DNA-binding MarR family transcriptional regulator
MTKLTDTQAAILRAAAEREGHIVLPLPGSLRGGAATKVVDTMVAKGLVEEVDADLRKEEPVWRETGDGHGTTLVATQTGLAAIGIAPESADSAPTGAIEAPAEDTETDAAAETKPAHKERKPRDGTKQALLIEMLRSENGATIAEIAEATGWQQHTVRGAIAGALKKKLGLDVTSEKSDQGERRYRIQDH